MTAVDTPPGFSAARRRFLRGDPAGKRETLLPPWSGDGATFHARCTRCGDCVSACPEHILVLSRQGYPYVRFESGGCTFCGECVTQCQPKALERAPQKTPWNLQARIADSCLARNQVVCQTCGERCEVGAIRFSLMPGQVSRPEVDAELCTGCGFCIADCPARAISMTFSMGTT